MSRPGPAVRSVAALAGHELRMAATRGENVLVTAVIPPGVLLFFAGSGRVPGIDGRPVDFLVPGTLALAVIASALVSLSIATGYERAYGALKRLGAAPIPGWAMPAAKIAALLAVEGLQVVLVLGVAVGILGWQPGPGASPVLAAAVLGLGTVAFAGLGLLLAGTLRAEATLALANALFLGFLALGGIIVPVELLPAGIEAVARLLPANALAELLRSTLGAPAGNPGLAAVVLAAWAVGTTTLAVRSFRWR